MIKKICVVPYFLLFLEKLRFYWTNIKINRRQYIQIQGYNLKRKQSSQLYHFSLISRFKRTIFFFLGKIKDIQFLDFTDDTCTNLTRSQPVYYLRNKKKFSKEVAHHQRASFNISWGVNEFSFSRTLTLPPPRHPSQNETNSNFKCYSVDLLHNDIEVYSLYLKMPLYKSFRNAEFLIEFSIS